MSGEAGSVGDLSPESNGEEEKIEESLDAQV